jgi:hypothetical protein
MSSGMQFQTRSGFDGLLSPRHARSQRWQISVVRRQLNRCAAKLTKDKLGGEFGLRATLALRRLRRRQPPHFDK